MTKRRSQSPAVRVFLIASAALLAAACSSTPEQTTGRYKVGDPYKVNGVWYYPKEEPAYDETGIASWYGSQFHGRKTANGETFNKELLTAAHRTLPMPTLARVTNLENGKSVVVRVNDRGPFAHGRVIDLSEQGATLLGFRQQGTARVRVQYLGRASLDPKEPMQVATATPRGQEMAVAAPTRAVEAGTLAPPPGTSAAPSRTSLPAPTPAPRASAPVAAPVAPAPVVETVAVPARTAIYIQAGAFANANNAERLKARLTQWGRASIAPATISGERLYRVRIGPFATVAEADATLERMLSSGVNGAQIVVD